MNFLLEKISPVLWRALSRRLPACGEDPRVSISPAVRREGTLTRCHIQMTEETCCSTFWISFGKQMDFEMEISTASVSALVELGCPDTRAVISCVQQKLSARYTYEIQQLDRFLSKLCAGNSEENCLHQFVYGMHPLPVLVSKLFTWHCK